jgi:hypothetical protein
MNDAVTSKIADAIAFAEGYFAAGSRPRRNNNYLRLRATALALRVLEAARYRACASRRVISNAISRERALGGMDLM